VQRRLLIHILTVALLPSWVAAQGAEPSVVVDDVWVQNDELHVSLAATGILDEAARETIEQGGTSAVFYTVTLYRHRSGWFDSVVDEPITIPFQVTYEPFERRYRMVGLDMRLKTEHFDEVVGQCTRLADVVLGNMAELRLDPDARYYVVIDARYEPMTVETFEELRTWMDSDNPADEQGRTRQRSMGSRIAQALMSAAGFGERELRGQSDTFRPSELPRRP